MPFNFKSVFESALGYARFVPTYGTVENQQRWNDMYKAVVLTEQQKQLLAGFHRRMYVLCLAGVWCGDCVNACPIFERFAEASPAINLKFVHRPQKFDPSAGDPATQLANELSICGGPRVPVLVFISEDWFECERFGERTLATYRKKAANMHSTACPTGLVAPPADILAANVAEWLEHFERVQLMLLTSPRLMKLHGEV
ncbi:MAG TPA: thioredoxin family protein [Phycisphaerae bacterium]|nr:thioredoxin family protein [Phycisphaerae bacterium]